MLKLDVKKKKMTSPGSAQNLTEILPLYPAFKCTLVSNFELNWNWLGTGLERTNWAAENTNKQTAILAFGQHNSFCSVSSTSGNHKQKSGKIVFSIEQEKAGAQGSS